MASLHSGATQEGGVDSKKDPLATNASQLAPGVETLHHFIVVVRALLIVFRPLACSGAQLPVPAFTRFSDRYWYVTLPYVIILYCSFPKVKYRQDFHRKKAMNVLTGRTGEMSLLCAVIALGCNLVVKATSTVQWKYMFCL